MPRKAKGARLWLRPESAREPSQWIIRDGRFWKSTGCGPDAHGEAEKQLAEYIASKHDPAKRGRSLDQIPVADVISLYLDDVVSEQTNPKKGIDRAARLLAFFGECSLAEINKKKCKEYAVVRGNGSARRELQDLSAAIGNALESGLFREIVKIWLPPAGKARNRFLMSGRPSVKIKRKSPELLMSDFDGSGSVRSFLWDNCGTKNRA